VSQASQTGAAGVAAPPAAAGTTAAPPAADQAPVSPQPTSASPSLEAQTPAQRKMYTPQRLRLLSLGVVARPRHRSHCVDLRVSRVVMSRAKADTAQLIGSEDQSTCSARSTATNHSGRWLRAASSACRHDQAMAAPARMIAEAARAHRRRLFLPL
jgi:hypothetical protein